LKIEDAVVLVTGANRGIGRAFVEAALRKGARKVYAAMRTPEESPDPRVQCVKLDVTDDLQARTLAQTCGDVTLLVNNAGIAHAGGFLAEHSAQLLQRHLDTNVFGFLQVTRAFAPILARNGGGAILNVLSILSWFNGPMLGAYGVSKSAAWAVTNGTREELRAQNTQVVALHMGFVDTDLARDFDAPKLSPQEVADRALDGVAAGATEVLIDERTRQVRQGLSAEPGFYLNPYNS